MAVIRDYLDGQFKDDPTEEVGIGGFTTAARVRESISRSREVPTTFLEDGSHVNDHIIRNPLTLSIEGTVSDVFRTPSPIIEAIRETETRVGEITQYAPARTQSQAVAVSGIVVDLQTQLDRADRAVQTAQNAAQFLGFTGSEGKTNTEKFVDFVEAAHASDALIRIDAPFRTYENMAITSVEYSRNNQTNSLEFTIQATQFRFVETTFSETAPVPASNTDGQTEGAAEKGSQEGEEQPQSFIDSTLERIGVL